MKKVANILVKDIPATKDTPAIRVYKNPYVDAFFNAYEEFLETGDVSDLTIHGLLTDDGKKPHFPYTTDEEEYKKINEERIKYYEDFLDMKSWLTGFPSKTKRFI